jgi:hypothetical protein
VSGLPLEILAVVAQLDTAFKRADHDVFDRLVADRGLSAEAVAAALRRAGVATWHEPPASWWHTGAVEAELTTEGSWTVFVPVWSEGRPTQVRLRYTVHDVFGDDEFWEPWVLAVEADRI